MDDLVKRLRDYINCRPWAEGRTFDATHPEVLIAQSADRIEELEAALLKITKMTPDPEFGTLPIEAAIKVARAALGEKKDD